MPEFIQHTLPNSDTYRSMLCEIPLTSTFFVCSYCFIRIVYYFVARNFKLLDELEEAEKGSKGGADVSLGKSCRTTSRSENSDLR